MSEIIFHCQDVAPVLYLYIDHEIENPAQTQAIEFHFENCPPCLSQYEVELAHVAQIKNILTSACHEQAPEGLREAISAQLTAMVAGNIVAQTYFSSVQITHTTHSDGVVESSIMSIEIESTDFHFPDERN
jgi:anti-sigma factor (TIGR02949 family)